MGQSALPATEAMLERLLGWPDQDRYLVQLLDEGDRYMLRVTPTSAAGVIHQGALSASLTWSNGTSNGISLQFDRRQGPLSAASRHLRPAGFNARCWSCRRGRTSSASRWISRPPPPFPGSGRNASISA